MDCEVEKINPYNDSDSKGEQIERMFDNIAPAYDFMNRAMTLGLDCIWRRIAVKMVGKYKPHQVLDIACGTGDLAMEICRRLTPDAITGIDLSEGMLAVAREKFKSSKYADIAMFEHCDCTKMPFDANRFDAITVAFGVRNFEHLSECYREMYRVLRPGGVLCVIELSTPTNPIVRPLYKLYTKGVIPLLGRLVSSDSRAYSYLPESIAAVPQGNSMLSLISGEGFTGCRFRTLTFGVCTIYIAEKR